MSRARLAFLVSLAFLAAHAGGAARSAETEQADRTGSRLKSNTTPRTVHRFAESGELERIIALLNEGRTEAAVELAQDYLESLQSVTFVGESSAVERYTALNAVCASLTKAGEIDEAVAACTRAVEMLPSRWTAYNNRGTAHFAGGRYEAALTDYRGALERASGIDGAVSTIEHNIALAEGRLASR